MKKLGYVLYVILLCFVFINSANAKEELMHCEYGKVYINKDQSQYIKYKVTYYDDKSVTHEYIPTDSLNYRKGSNRHSQVGVFDSDGNRAGTMNDLKDNFTAEEMQKYYEKKTCPYIMFKSLEGSLADRSITPVSTTKLSDYTNNNERELVISANNGFYVKPQAETEPPTNIKGTCVYEASYNTPGNTTNTKVTCNVSNSGVSCSSNNLSVVSSGVSLLPSSFKSGNAFKCPSEIYALVDATNNKITNISLTKGTYYDTLKLNKGESTSSSNEQEPTPVPELNSYEKDERYIQAYNDANKYCNPTNFAFYDNEKCTEAQNRMQEIKAEYEAGDSTKYEINAFCHRKEIRSTFRVIGWIIFIIKILVPLILIIFGIIDFTKAIIASKDDEIKNATKSVIIRVIAGFAIFFVPLVIDFIVTIFDDKNIYDENSGSFGYCTHCMLNPTDDACGNLMGGD